MGFKLQEGINICSNQAYHGDTSWTSSSGLKKLYTDPEQYYIENILGQKKEEAENPAFTEGSLTHSLILEPDTVHTEYAFFDGLRKSGPQFEAFKEEAGDRLIISKPQMARCQQNLRAFKANPLAVELIKGGLAEHTICKIWQDMRLKVRCDYINVDKGYIADVKTSAWPTNYESFKLTVSQYSYELSAALYAKLAELHYGKPFDFFFIAISKKDSECHVYRTSQLTMRRGLEMCQKAIDNYKLCMQTGVWKLPDQQQSKMQSSEEILEV